MFTNRRLYPSRPYVALHQTSPRINNNDRSSQDEVASHPKHHLSPKTRRALYDLIQTLTPMTAQQVCGWTAVITAQRVLPIFERALPNERMPRRLLSASATYFGWPTVIGQLAGPTI